MLGQRKAMVFCQGGHPATTEQNSPAAAAVQAMHSLIDVAAQHCLKGLGQEASLDHQALLPVQAAAGTQLSQQVRADVLVVAVHGL